MSLWCVFRVWLILPHQYNCVGRNRSPNNPSNDKCNCCCCPWFITSNQVDVNFFEFFIQTPEDFWKNAYADTRCDSTAIMTTLVMHSIRTYNQRQRRWKCLTKRRTISYADFGIIVIQQCVNDCRFMASIAANRNGHCAHSK